MHPVCSNCAKTREKCAYSSNTRENAVPLTELSPEETRHGIKRRKEDSGPTGSGSDEESPPSTGNGQHDRAEFSKANESIESRLDRLTSMIEALGRGNDKGTAGTKNGEPGLRREKRSIRSDATPSFRSSNGRDANDRLTALVPAMASENQKGPNGTRSRGASIGPSPKSPGVDVMFELPTSTTPELTDTMNNLNLGYLNVQDGGRSRYIGSTFWAYMSDELDQLNQLLRDQNRYHSATSIVNKHFQEATPPRDISPFSEDSHESQYHNSFHTAGDNDHHHKSELRDDCPACLSTAFDKTILLLAGDAHPSRFRRMSRDILTGIPTEQQSHVLFRCWLSGVHPHVTLTYPPMVLEKYEQFWAWNRDRDSNETPFPDTSFMALLYAIWYAGSVSISLRGLKTWFKNTTRAKLSAGFHDQVTRCLTLASFPRSASLPSLAAYLMLQSILAREEEPFTSSLFISLALRVAHTMGLHRDPGLFNFEPWEAEARRRIWFHILQLDCYIAISSGLPPLVQGSNFWDVRMISELKDGKIGTKEGQEYEEAVAAGKRGRDDPDEPNARDRPSMVAVQYVMARGKYLMVNSIRHLLTIQLRTNPMTRKDMEEVRQILIQIDQDLNVTIQRIPTKGIPELGFSPNLDCEGEYLIQDHQPAITKPPTKGDLRPFIGMTPKDGLNSGSIQYHWNTLASLHKWGRIGLSMLIDKAHCVFYQPFLKNFNSKLWSASRQCALRHCHGFMRKFISLATDPAFQPFHWNWPGSHQPMHATMIMLVDLYERPHSKEAPRSRALIDKVFSMSGPDGGIVSGEDGVSVQRPLREGGREAWDMLRRLRDKAWQKAGLDPDVLWGDEDQIRAGVAHPLTETERITQALREDFLEPPKPSKPMQSMSTSPSVPNIDRNHKPQNGRLSKDNLHSSNSSSTGRTPSLDTDTPPQAQQEFAVIQESSQPQYSTKSSTAPAGNIPVQYPYPLAVGPPSIQVDPYNHNTISNPVPSMAPPTSYFNPPTAVSSNTQQTEANTKTSPSENPVTDVQYGVSPNFPRQLAGPYPSNGTAPQEQDQHFDWDEWDAVFGQYVPLDDMVMEALKFDGVESNNDDDMVY